MGEAGLKKGVGFKFRQSTNKLNHLTVETQVLIFIVSANSLQSQRGVFEFSQQKSSCRYFNLCNFARCDHYWIVWFCLYEPSGCIKRT